MSLVSFSDNFAQISLYQNIYYVQLISKLEKYNAKKKQYAAKKHYLIQIETRFTRDYFLSKKDL